MTAHAVVCLAEGEAEGPVTIWDTPLSFWGGFDSATGRVIDRSHPAFGQAIVGHVLVMPSGRGSSSSSSVLAEAVRCGTAPAALVLAQPDPIITVGSIVAHRLYGTACPVVVWPTAHATLTPGLRVRVVAREAGSYVELM